MKKKSRLRGFTLVETMTSLVIMVILIAIASGVIITTFNIFGKNALFRAAQNEGNNVYNFLYNNISYATGLKIGKSDDIYYDENSSLVRGFDEILKKDKYEKFTDSNDNEIIKDSIQQYYEVIKISESNKKGVVSLNRKNVNTKLYLFGSKDGTPYNFDCKISFAKKSENMLNCTVTIGREEEIFYEKSGNIPLYNEKEISGNFFINGEEDAISNQNNDIVIIYTYIQ